MERTTLVRQEPEPWVCCPDAEDVIPPPPSVTAALEAAAVAWLEAFGPPAGYELAHAHFVHHAEQALWTVAASLGYPLPS